MALRSVLCVFKESSFRIFGPHNSFCACALWNGLVQTRGYAKKVGKVDLGLLFFLFVPFLSQEQSELTLDERAVAV